MSRIKIDITTPIGGGKTALANFLALRLRVLGFSVEVNDPDKPGTPFENSERVRKLADRKTEVVIDTHPAKRGAKRGEKL